jgi:hypothetical protein
MKFPCQQCGEMCEGKLDSVSRAMGGTRRRVFSVECGRHGIFSKEVLDRAFKIGVAVRLSERNTVSCPCCDTESPAVITDESREIGGPRLRLIEVDCPTHGLFYGREETSLGMLEVTAPKLSRPV